MITLPRICAACIGFVRRMQRIFFKFAVMVYQCVRGLGPAYLADAVQPVARIPGMNMEQFVR